MRTIALLQLKGGSGRSTVSTTLAAYYSSRRHRTLLIDCDRPQLSSCSWYSVRKQREDVDCRYLECVTASNGVELFDILVSARERGFEYAILDCAPRLEELNRSAIVYADLLLTPIGASYPEVWATQDLQALLDEAKRAREYCLTYGFWNRFRASTRVGADLSEELPKVWRRPMMKARLPDRVAFVEAFGRGLSVPELKGAPKASVAAVNAFCREVTAILKRICP